MQTFSLHLIKLENSSHFQTVSFILYSPREWPCRLKNVAALQKICSRSGRYWIRNRPVTSLGVRCAAKDDIHSLVWAYRKWQRGKDDNECRLHTDLEVSAGCICKPIFTISAASWFPILIFPIQNSTYLQNESISCWRCLWSRHSPWCSWRERGWRGARRRRPTRGTRWLAGTGPAETRLWTIARKQARFQNAKRKRFLNLFSTTTLLCSSKRILPRRNSPVNHCALRGCSSYPTLASL